MRSRRRGSRRRACSRFVRPPARVASRERVAPSVRSCANYLDHRREPSVSVVTTEVDRSAIDLVNPDNYVERIPFEWFDLLRREEPVTWHEEPGTNAGFWAVTR